MGWCFLGGGELGVVFWAILMIQGGGGEQGLAMGGGGGALLLFEDTLRNFPPVCQ